MDIFKFVPAEYLSLMVLGLIGAVVLASGSLIKAVAMILLWLAARASDHRRHIRRRKHLSLPQRRRLWAEPHLHRTLGDTNLRPPRA